MVTNGNKTKNGVGAPTKATPEIKADFIRLYPEWGSIGTTAKQIGVSRKTIYNWFKEDAEFRAEYEALVLERRDDLISRIYRAGTGRLTASHDEIGACITLLKATDHLADEFETAKFTEKQISEGKLELIVKWDGNRNETGNTPTTATS